MLTVERTGAVLHLTLNRPEVRNAFNDELIQALLDQFTDMNPDVRAVVIRGAGSVFCAGGDLNWMRAAASYTEEQNIADALRLANLYDAICRCRPLVIVIAQGAAFGGGAGLVAAADVAIAVSGAKFCFSEVKLGLIPATISTIVVPKIGVSAARALFTTAEVFDAAHAQRIGLVHKIAEDPEHAEKHAAQAIELVLSCGPEAVHKSKLLAQDAPLPHAEAARRLAEARASDEGREGIAAFLDKRPAAFVEKP